MSKSKDIQHLAVIATLARDIKLSKVAKAGAARNKSLQQLIALSPPTVSDSDLPPLVVADATLRHQHSAARKRAEINRTLAQQTALWLQARDDARIAFGRADVLTRLSKKC
ncbi:MAG: hypothetical protein Q7J57_11110 [Gemmobacter sp.]|nr:hypothetical protein [Gemmobacter sp.]